MTMSIRRDFVGACLQTMVRKIACKQAPAFVALTFVSVFARAAELPAYRPAAPVTGVLRVCGNDQMAALLQGAVRARLNIVVSGGTGSGKTTLLNALSRFISDSERIVTIEDAAELQLQQRHVLPLESRPPNIEGKGAVTVRDLVRNALRMRPDRIVVGECRGAEALDMLQAMNTGHDGSLTTIHANTPRDVLSRLETMVLMAGYDLPIKAIRQQIAGAVDLIVQTARMQGGVRKVTAITEVLGLEQDTIQLQDLFVFEQTGVSDQGRARGRFKSTGVRPHCAERFATVTSARDWFVAEGHAPPVELDPVDVATLRTVRELVRDVVSPWSAAAGPARVELDRLTTGLVLRPGWAPGPLHLDPTGTGLEPFLGWLVLTAHEATIAGTWRRLKSCRNNHCRWVYFDHSRNATGTWCATQACGSRHKARAYRQRRKEEPK